jgi:hypothetical protein
MPTGEEAPIWTYFPSLCDTTQRSSLPFKDPLLRETNVAGAIFEKVRKNSSGKNRRGWRWISESQAAQNMPFGHGSVCITETWVKTRNELKLRNNKKLHYNQSVWGYIQFYTCVKGTTIPTNQYIYFFFGTMIRHTAKSWRKNMLNFKIFRIPPLEKGGWRPLSSSHHWRQVQFFIRVNHIFIIIISIHLQWRANLGPCLSNGQPIKENQSVC